MMEGHFIDTLLDPVYRDSGAIFFTWKYFRGITAPVFFTISGFIFSYLLMKVAGTSKAKKRLKKGVKRGLLLLFLGYLLRAPILSWLQGSFSSYFFVVDVLHCIGLSLIIIVGLYRLCDGKKVLLMTAFGLLWIGIFVSEPLYRDQSFDFLPAIFSNYLTKANGSVFTIIPWFGYVAFGSMMAICFDLFEKVKSFKWISISLMLLIGGVVFRFSSYLFMELYYGTDVLVFKQIAYLNYLFPRLGDVLILFAIFYALNKYLNIEIVGKVGQKTLSIYVIHFIILYGSFSGLGLRQVIGATLNPYFAGLGACIFIAIVCFLSLTDLKSNQFFYKKWKRLLKVTKRKLRLSP